jgi:hypothetical protein
MYKCIITSTEEGYENAFIYKCIIHSLLQWKL